MPIFQPLLFVHRQTSVSRRKVLSMERIVFIWDDYEKDSYFHQLVCQDREIPERDIISAPEAYEEFLETEINSTVKAIVLLAELRWNNNLRTEYYAFNIVKELRFRHVYCPIFISSFLPESAFRKQENLLFKILRKPLHKFIQLPLTREDLQLIQSQDRRMSKIGLNDILFHTYTYKGRVRGIFHDLQDRYFKQENEKGQGPLLLKEILKEIEPYIDENKLEAFNQIASAVLEKHGQSQSIALALKTYKEEVLELVLQENHENSFTRRTTEGWKVLFIDDNPETCNEVRSRFAGIGVECVTAGDFSGAKRILEEDLYPPADDRVSQQANSITVVVTDLRFHNEEDIDDWHDFQGYDIIDFIYNELDNMVSFFILTSKKGAVIQGAQRADQVKIQWFGKDDVFDETSDSGFNVFAERIVEEGQKIFDALCSLPQEGYWKKIYNGFIEYPLSAYYRRHRLSSTYEEKEKWINQCAEQFFHSALELKYGKMFENDIVEVKGFKPQFTAKLLEGPSHEDTMEKFYVKLIGRRVALALHQRSKWSDDNWTVGDIANVLKYRTINPTTGSSIKFLTSFLCLPKEMDDDIPHNLLVEERAWLMSLGLLRKQPDEILYKALYKFTNKLCNKFRTSSRVPEKYSFIFDSDEVPYFTQRKTAIKYLASLDELTRLSFNREQRLFFEKSIRHILDRPEYENAIRRNDLRSFLAGLLSS